MMEEIDELEHVLLEQQTHELVCPDCEACITHEVIVRKRKRNLNEPSPGQQYPAGADEGNDPDSELPHMLFDQESHDLICPVCEHAVTGEVILQKRKREIDPDESGGSPHGIQASNQDERNALSMRATPDGVGDTAEEDELVMRSALQEQESYDLLCPDCESCITHEVILEKRKRPITSDAIPGKKQDKKPPLHPRRRRAEGVEELNDSDEEDPPLKRHRRAVQALQKGADPEEKQIKRILQDQRVYDLTCPDCASHITYQVLLKDKASESGKPVSLHEKRGGRPRRRVTSYLDDNPWRTRYKLIHGHSKPFAVSKAIAEGNADKRKDPQQRVANYGAIADKRKDPQQRVANYGAIADSSLREDVQPRVPNYGAIADNSLREDFPRLVSKYEANANSLLTEPLLPGQREVTGEGITIKGRYMELKSQAEDFMGPAITYFLVLAFLYCIWYILRILPPA